MRVSFVKLSPSENTTIIITEPEVKKEEYGKIATAAMAYSHLHGEQVGFLTPTQTAKAKGRMEMSGGEFCGNGLLALGAYVAWREAIEKERFSLEFSGVEKALSCEVEKTSSVSYRVKGEMPVKEFRILQKEISVDNGSITGDLVEMTGITHFLFPIGDREKSVIDFSLLLKNIEKEGENQAYGALGYWERGGEIEMSPWVYVPGINSLREERSCGSGSLALGLLWAKKREKNIKETIRQPGGSIGVEIVYDREKKKVTSASIETEVVITCEGKLFL